METKFPFEPNERVKAAFRNSIAQEDALRVITKALIEAVAQSAARVMPWKILQQEHPKVVAEARKELVYDHITETFDLKPTLDRVAL